MTSFNNKRIYLACGHTDMRKSINGLAAIVETKFKLDLFGASVFIFCNRNRDRIKILDWDGNGFWLYFKRLERGHFKWPALNGVETTLDLNNDELTLLLDGSKIVQKLMRKEIKIGTVI